jgi:hypothetical protein
MQRPYLRCRNDYCELVDDGSCGVSDCPYDGAECSGGPCESPNSRPQLLCVNNLCEPQTNAQGQPKCGQSDIYCQIAGGWGACNCQPPLPTSTGDPNCPWFIDPRCHTCPENTTLNGNQCCRDSPLLIDLEDDGYRLTNAVNGVNFDLNVDGEKERISWTVPGGDDAWLILDRNQNGQIDDGSELFGNRTFQPSSSITNGFLALAEYDRLIMGGNQDGVIDQRDLVYYLLRLWQDLNHNGIAELEELSTMQNRRIVQIDLDYQEKKQQDEFGNWFRYKGRMKIFENDHLKNRVLWDVYLLRQ